MRGSEHHIAGVPQAVAVLDLAMAGVVCEMGEEAFDWLGAAPAARPATPAAPATTERHVREGDPAGHSGRTFKPLVVPPDNEKHAEKSPSSVDKKVVATPPPAGTVWTEGDAGGVVLVVQGPCPEAKGQALARAMLAAVGLGDRPLAWVGYDDGVVDAAVLRDAVRGMESDKVLVMGQGPLGALLARNLGVEGWHAAGGSDVGLAGAVGVTYPLDLLLKQPLFKRLAWQHLLTWMEGF